MRLATPKRCFNRADPGGYRSDQADKSSRRSGLQSAREIAARYKIPVELMAKVLQRLAKRGLLASHQGTRGGYHLARPAARISVADVVQAIDGPVMVTACSDIDESCDQYLTCNVRDPLWRLKERIVHTLAEFTIDELARADPLAPLPLAASRTPAAPLAWSTPSEN